MDTTSLAALAAEWRHRAAGMVRYAPQAACAFEDAAAELDGVAARLAGEMLSLQAAAEVSGYSADHLGRLIRAGRLANCGRPHAPRLRRADLPIKPGHQVADSEPPPHMEELTRRAISSKRRAS